MASRTSKGTLVVETFLNLEAEHQEVILTLGILNEDIEYYFGLDSDAFDEERVGRNVCCVLGESTAFAVYHQIADTYAQARGFVTPN